MAYPLAGLDDGVAAALQGAAASVGRLSAILSGHPLLPAVLHRARLEAVRRQAAVDGCLIDPWHLAAILEGLRIRMDPYVRIIDRGQIFEAARAALDCHAWLVGPDFDREGLIQAASASLASHPSSAGSLVQAARWLHAWIESGGDRPPARAALVRFWRAQHLLPADVPLTGPAALAPGAPWGRGVWEESFLSALAVEAGSIADVACDLERAWVSARAIAGRDRRSSSRARAAVDVLAASPLVSSITLAAALRISPRNASIILDDLVARGVAVELTHRSRRRLFGMSGLSAFKEAVAGPYRPSMTRGRGRPRLIAPPEDPVVAPPPLGPCSRLDQRAFDYSALDAAMAVVDETMKRTRVNIESIVAGPG